MLLIFILNAIEKQKALDAKAKEEAENRKNGRGKKRENECFKGSWKWFRFVGIGNAISQGNEEIGKEVKKKKPNMETMRLAQAQISMGVKRKIELQEDISAMKKKIASAEKRNYRHVVDAMKIAQLRQKKYIGLN